MALVVQRHVGESVLVGEHLEVTLEHVSGPRVTIAIAHRAGGHAVRRTLAGPAARVRVGPVAIQARRAPSGRAVRLTFDAPRQIAITRRELLERTAADGP